MKPRLRAIASSVTSESPSGNLEYVVSVSGIEIAAGWARGDLNTGAPYGSGLVYRYRRPDVDVEGLPGFMAFFPAHSTSMAGEEITASFAAAGILGLPQGLDAFRAGPVTGGLLAEALTSLTQGALPSQAPFVVAATEALSDAFPEAGIGAPDDAFASHVDKAYWIAPAQTLVVHGWCPRGAEISLSPPDPFSVAEAPEGVAWFDRPDVVAAMGPAYAGFTATLHGVQSSDLSRPLVFAWGGHRRRLQTQVDIIDGADPREVARRVFAHAGHARDFIPRLKAGEGEALRRVITSWNTEVGANSLVQLKSSSPVEPDLSVVVPLYGRYDLLWNQFQSWAESQYTPKTQFILVNDDPPRQNECLELVECIASVYGLGVTLLSHRLNRGFAAACNSGAQAAEAPFLLLLNSDAILESLDGAYAAISLMERADEIGVAGAVIKAPDGTVAHVGMSATYLSGRSSWFNYHLGTGLPAPDVKPGEWWTTDAVTGAVMLLRTAEFLEMGGMSEDFLIGDYEDSDLCWRFEERGKLAVVAADLRAVHLHRTSMSMIGDESFRERVSLFNSWLHQSKWLDHLAQRFPDGEAVKR